MIKARVASRAPLNAFVMPRVRAQRHATLCIDLQPLGDQKHMIIIDEFVNIQFQLRA